RRGHRARRAAAIADAAVRVDREPRRAGALRVARAVAGRPTVRGAVRSRERDGPWAAPHGRAAPVGLDDSRQHLDRHAAAPCRSRHRGPRRRRASAAGQGNLRTRTLVTRVLGIETSCDETSIAILDGAGNDVKLRSLVILSQDVHRIFGGVVPELASRAHLTSIEPVLRRALTEADAALGSIGVVAITVGPGLVGALLVGVSFGKALAYALRQPIVGVHHMEGHLFATSLEHSDAVPPFTALLVSGGHTMIVDVEAWGRYRMLGRTRDDAAGEAFDKVAKLLGLPYPGGPHLERIAADGVRDGLRFSRPMLRRDQRAGDPDYYALSL